MSRTSIDWYQAARELRDRSFTRVTRASFAAFGTGSVIEMPVTVTGSRRIAIGREVRIGRGSWLYTHDELARLEIGDRTAISGFCVLSAAHSVRVGKAVLFARNVHVADHSHGRRSHGVPIRDQPLEDIAPVSIGDGVWLGQNVVVLPGSQIGEGAVIGANAVVRGVVPARTVAVGAPARIVSSLDGASLEP
jgi:acetyltransferase-like isoleucine patch superfamily enzyme